MRDELTLIHRFLQTHPDLFDDAAALRLEPDEHGRQDLALSGKTVWLFCDWLFEQGYRSAGEVMLERLISRIPDDPMKEILVAMARHAPKQFIHGMLMTARAQAGRGDGADAVV